MDAQSTLYVQQVCERFLYYAIAVYQIMLVALNSIATSQAQKTTTTKGDIVWLLNYTVAHPDATLYYHASDIILHVASDVPYLCEARAHSRSRGHFLLSNQLVDNRYNHPPSPLTTAPSTPCARSSRM